MGTTSSMPATLLLDQWEYEQHPLHPMGHDDCRCGGKTFYSFTGWATIAPRGGRRHLVGVTLGNVEYDRDHGLVYASTPEHRFRIALAEWDAAA
ncbi:MAG: hypothetical protein WBD40_00205 [Tepidisphaeraceae bacterium]